MTTTRKLVMFSAAYSTAAVTCTSWFPVSAGLSLSKERELQLHTPASCKPYNNTTWNISEQDRLVYSFCQFTMPTWRKGDRGWVFYSLFLCGLGVGCHVSSLVAMCLHYNCAIIQTVFTACYFHDTHVLRIS